MIELPLFYKTAKFIQKKKKFSSLIVKRFAVSMVFWAKIQEPWEILISWNIW